MIRAMKACLESRMVKLALGGMVALLVARVLWADGSRLAAGVAGGTVGIATIGLAVACLIPCLLPLALLRRKGRPTAALSAAGPSAACGCGAAECGAPVDEPASSR